MSVAGDEADAPLPRPGYDSRETRGDTRSSYRVSVFIRDKEYVVIALTQKLDNSPTENSWDVLFVGVAV